MAAKKSTGKNGGKRETSVPEGETKDQKFIRLTNKRMPKVLNSIRTIGNLATYPHSPEAAQKIIDALDSAITQVQQRFTAPTQKEKPTFTL